MSQQRRNASQVSILSADFPMRSDASYAWGRVISCILGIAPHLRLFIPFSSVNESFDAYDLSGQGRTMTGTALVAACYNNFGALAPYIAYDGVSMYHTRADEAGLDLTATGLTVMCWAYYKALTARMGLITKDDGTNANCNFGLYERGDVASDPAQFVVANGVNSYSINSTVVPVTGMVPAQLYFVAGRWVPSVSVDVFVDDTKTSNVTGIPATLNNSTAPLNFGGRNDGATLLNGGMTLAAIWNTWLTDTQIEAIRQAAYPLFFGA